LLSLTVSEVRPNASVDIPVPDAVRQAAAPYARVTAQQVAEGVWYLTGGTHHSTVIEMLYHVIVTESPLNDDRALAVIAEVKRLVPNKPIRYVVNSITRPLRTRSRRDCQLPGQIYNMSSGRITAMWSCVPPPAHVARPAAVPQGLSEALSYPILRRLASPSQSARRRAPPGCKPPAGGLGGSCGGDAKRPFAFSIRSPRASCAITSQKKRLAWT
jgi:hypothetical protein